MLYIVGTPIGNLSEITLRALEVLKGVDAIGCEDTRTSSVLLKHYDINKRLFAYHKFNERSAVGKIIDMLKSGKNIAIISDAGMPVISDPGNILINELIKNNLEYTVVSGACALVNAFILSGFSYPFTFLGFLPNKKSELKNMLNAYKNVQTSLIIYLAPHDIKTTLSDIFSILGDRNICIVREISKKFEEVNFSTLAKGYEGIDKGEFVLIVDKGEQTNSLNDKDIKEHYLHYIDNGLSKNDAIKQVAHDRKIKKDVVYKEVNNI